MQTIYLDISNKGVYPCVYAKQTDVGRKFKVVLTDSGVPYEIPNGSLVSIWFNGASGEGNYSDINGKSATEILGNTITVELIEQMLKVPGDGIVCLILNDSNGNQIGSWNLQYIVEFVPGVDSEVATEYYTAFSEAVKQLGELSKKLVIDDTLSVEGAAADAAKTGALLNEKAPSGFGLGTQAVNPPNNSLDEAVGNGWYVVSPSFAGAPTGHPNIGYGSVLVTNRDGVIIQEYTSTAASAILGYPLKLIRTKNESGAWTEWEWVNPPMQAGVEYRTTERSEGKPVYAKRITYTVAEAIDASSTVDIQIPHGASYFRKCVRVNAIYGNYPLPQIPSNGTYLSVHYVGDTNITVKAIRKSIATSVSFVLDFYYTKTQ